MIPVDLLDTAPVLDALLDRERRGRAAKKQRT
jgi:hypothetical protein